MMATTLSNSAALIEQITSELGAAKGYCGGKGMMLGGAARIAALHFDSLIDKARDNHHLIITWQAVCYPLLPPLNMSADETIQILRKTLHLIQKPLLHLITHQLTK